MWLCKCDCGNETIVERGQLTRQDSKSTRSCGCYAKEQIIAYNKKSKVVHGLYGTRIHTVWKDMIYRCEKPNCDGYKNYGARGITVCEEWHDLKKFAEWAYSTGYDDTAEKGECTIERIDVNGNYEPSNCTWVNMFMQNTNRRITVKVDVNGVETPLMIAVKDAAVDYRPVYARMRNHGDSFDDAVERVKTHKNEKLSQRWKNKELTHERLITHDGKTQNMTAWAREIGIDIRKFSYLFNKGKTIDQIAELYC